MLGFGKEGWRRPARKVRRIEEGEEAFTRRWYGGGNGTAAVRHAKVATTTRVIDTNDRKGRGQRPANKVVEICFRQIPLWCMPRLSVISSLHSSCNRYEGTYHRLREERVPLDLSCDTRERWRKSVEIIYGMWKKGCLNVLLRVSRQLLQNTGLLWRLRVLGWRLSVCTGFVWCLL